VPTDIELQRGIRRASAKRRLGGIGFILMGAMLMAFGYFSNTSEQQEFTRKMNSGTPLSDTSSGLMNLMPIVMMGIGLVSGVMGVRSLVRQTSAIEREEVEVELRTKEKQAHEPTNTGKAELRFDGVYKGSGSASTLLRFYPNGKIAYEAAMGKKKPMRFYIELEKVSDPSELDEKTMGKKTLPYSVYGEGLSISVPQWHPNAVDAVRSLLGGFSGTVGVDQLKLGNVEYAFVEVVMNYAPESSKEMASGG
jgi:hypothetical protein